MLPPRAYTFFGLNAVRVLSIVSLLLVFSSTIFVMVNNIRAVNRFEAGEVDEDMMNCDYIEGSTVPNQAAGVFWAIVSSLLIIFQTVILILSEIGWPISFFDRFFPVLGSAFGLGALGIFQALIATQILSHHADDFTLVAAFFLFSLGCLNMLLGLIFRESAKPKRSIRVWKQESRGILPTVRDARPAFVGASPSFVAGVFSDKKIMRGEREQEQEWSDEKAGYGFGRMGEKAAGLRGFVLQTPPESLPRYATPPHSSNGRGRREAPSSRSSSSSSFASPYRESRSLSPSPPPSRSRTPVFKSSATAI